MTVSQAAIERIWVVVADSARARLFRSEHANGELTEVRDFLNPEARMAPHELVSDREGRVSVGGDTARRHGVGDDDVTQPTLRRRFAAAIADELGRLRCKGELTRCYLVAEPKVLGELRTALDAATAECVAGTISAGLVKHSVKDIRQSLPYRL